jgi:hypothetical protein
MQFRSPLDKLERFCLIIKQTSGKNPLHIYSANFDVNAKPESGDDASKDKKNASTQTLAEKQSTEQSQTLLTSSESNVPLLSPKETDSNSDESEENKPPPDYRPKINFEFRGSQ